MYSFSFFALAYTLVCTFRVISSFFNSLLGWFEKANYKSSISVEYFILLKWLTSVKLWDELFIWTKELRSLQLSFPKKNQSISQFIETFTFFSGKMLLALFVYPAIGYNWVHSLRIKTSSCPGSKNGLIFASTIVDWSWLLNLPVLYYVKEKKRVYNDLWTTSKFQESLTWITWKHNSSY